MAVTLYGIALCEGDDFWTSEDKLSTQVAKLEATPNASACFHSADDLDENTGELIAARWSRPFFAEEYSLDDLFEHGNFVPTASLVFRRELLGDLPALLSEVPHGDFAILAKLLTCGPLIYIDKSMSVYRRHSGGQPGTAIQKYSRPEYDDDGPQFLQAVYRQVAFPRRAGWYRRPQPGEGNLRWCQRCAPGPVERCTTSRQYSGGIGWR